MNTTVNTNLDGIIATNPGCLQVTDDSTDETYVFAQCERKHIARFMREVLDSGNGDKTVANERLLRDLLRYPSAEVFTARIAERPGLLIALVDPVTQAAGMHKGFTSTRPKPATHASAPSA